MNVKTIKWESMIAIPEKDSVSINSPGRNVPSGIGRPNPPSIEEDPQRLVASRRFTPSVEITVNQKGTVSPVRERTPITKKGDLK